MILNSQSLAIFKHASEAFSLVMKTNTCLSIRVLTRNTCLHLEYMSSPGIRVLAWCTCPHLAYVSSTGICVLNRRTCPQLANMSSSSTSPSPSWECTQKSMRLPRVQVHGDHGMDRCHYAVPFKGISIRSTPEIVLSSKRN